MKYFQNSNEFYKVNLDLKRITKVQNNVVTYPDFDSNIEIVSKFKKIKLNAWKHIECSFFISRDFEWLHDGIFYKTCDEPLDWKPASTCGRECLIFHNGKVWIGNDYYYPRILLSSIFEKNEIEKLDKKDPSYVENLIKTINKNQKWTSAKYCRNFKPIIID